MADNTIITRSERLKTARGLIKEDETHLFNGDVSEAHEIFGINFSAWITNAHPPQEGEIFNFDDAGVHRISTQQDAEQLLRDIKLLFRAEHVILLLEALRPWETYFAILGEAYKVAFKNFDGLLTEVIAEDQKSIEAFKGVINTVVGIGITALVAATGGAAVAALPMIAAASVLAESVKAATGEEAPELKEIASGKISESGWIQRKLEALLKTPMKFHEKQDKHIFLASLAERLGQIKALMFTVDDVTADRDVRMLLDYVHYQSKMGLKVGLNLKTGRQDDTRARKDGRKTHYEGFALVRKTRNMLEKAFEYQFDLLLQKMRFPDELRAIEADQASSLPAMAARIELELWRRWLVRVAEKAVLDQRQKSKQKIYTSEKITAADLPDKKYVKEELKTYICNLIRDVGASCQEISAKGLMAYKNWIALGVGLPASQSLARKQLGKPGARAFAKEKFLLTWALEGPRVDPIHLVALPGANNTLLQQNEMSAKDLEDRIAVIEK